MTLRSFPRVLVFLLGATLASPVFSGFGHAKDAPTAAIENPDKHVTEPFHVSPGPVDGRIAFVTARLLEEAHYSKQPFDRAVSGKLFDRYLESLDPQHMHFLQSDIAQFEPYRTNLGDMTVTRQGVADTRPAYEIFNRFIERLQQRVAYADELLKGDPFKFDSDEKIMVNRHESPYPKDLSEAKELWRQRVKFEYLQEKLSRIDAKKKLKNSASKNDSQKSDQKPKTEAEEIVQTLEHNYHRSLRNFTDWHNDDVLQVYLDALAHVYDPHSDYMGPQNLDSFAISMNLALSGIGAELQSEDGYCTIRRLLPGGPAVKSKKINEKDRIVAVAQGDKPPVDVVDMNLNKVVQMIRGPKGTEVRLTVLPAGAASADSKVIALVRDEIKLEDQAAKAKVIEVPGDQGESVRLGVIDLPSFYAQFDFGAKRRDTSVDEAAGGKSTSADVARLLKKLKAENVKGVILDLRRNGGGSLEEAIKLTGLFIKEGPVVQVRNFQGKIEEDDDTDPAIQYDGPLMVLTSRFSASASEIVAGALQDYGRAVVVGDSSTHGKGTVQSVNGLQPYMNLSGGLATNDPGALKLTIKKFYRASGASTQLKGVVPDVVLPSLANESKEIGEAALDNPLPWDTIPSSKFERLNMVEPYVPELRKRSEDRIALDKEFAYLREDIEIFKKQQADKTLSLNEKQRLKEKGEAEARQKARDKERLARKETNEKIYELSLRQAEMAGLPAPVQKTNSTFAHLHGGTGISSASVNSNSAAISSKNPELASDDSADDEKPSPIDYTLEEAQHILIDYLAVLQRKSVLTAGHHVD